MPARACRWRPGRTPRGIRRTRPGGRRHLAGLGPAGRFAALTNVRDPSQALGKRSRGELVADFLRGGGNPADYLAQVAGRAADYSGFNLLIGDRHQLWHYNPA